jgi:membrane protein YdbS with pleckstrin-like domain
MTGDGALVPLERRVLQLWRIRAGLVAGPAVVVTAALVTLGAGVPVGVATLAVLVVVAGGAIWWWTGLVWGAWRFEVGATALELRHGVLTRRESTIPLHRVQHIDTEAGPLERRFGLTTLVLRTASASSDSSVPGIDAAEAEQLRARILALVGTGDAV